MKRETKKKKSQGKRRRDCNEMKSNGVVFFIYLFICLFIYFADARLQALDFIWNSDGRNVNIHTYGKDAKFSSRRFVHP